MLFLLQVVLILSWIYCCFASKHSESMAETGRVHPNCVNAANPYHECGMACLDKIAQGQGQKEKKKFGNYSTFFFHFMFFIHNHCAQWYILSVFWLGDFAFLTWCDCWCSDIISEVKNRVDIGDLLIIVRISLYPFGVMTISLCSVEFVEHRD